MKADPSALRDRIANAIRGGYTKQTGPVSWQADLAGTCLHPVRMSEYHTQVTTAEGTPGDSGKYLVTLARCRSCKPCMDHRKEVWTARAFQEWCGSSRVWFGTLTFAPEKHYMLMVQAIKRSTLSADLWARLDEAERFARVEAEAAREVQLWLKRVRKAIEPMQLRYMLVAERHKSGNPHYHLLLHEQTDGSVTKRLMEDQWEACGFSAWRLLSGAHGATGVHYVAKYLNKTTVIRVRASKHYGMRPGHRTGENEPQSYGRTKKPSLREDKRLPKN